MGANNSILALLKVSEAIAADGITTASSSTEEASVNIAEKLDWQYFVEYNDRGSSTSSLLNLFNRNPTPTNIDRDIKTQFIFDPKGIDARKLKNVAKNQITEYIYSIQKDEDFHNWLKSLENHIGKSEANKTTKSAITPIFLVNTINTDIERYLTPDAICTYAGCIDTFSNIGTHSIIIKNTSYPSGLHDYAKKSIQHAYVASIAGLLISILQQNASTEYIVSEIYKSADTVKRIDSIIMLIIVALFVFIVLLGGYNIFTVIVNEAHHDSQFHAL